MGMTVRDIKAAGASILQLELEVGDIKIYKPKTQLSSKTIRMSGE
jgi:hypothetical protein